LSVEDSNIAPVPALANDYYQEARLCWYNGAFVASIIMSQLCLEETLRAYYRAANGVDGYLNGEKKVNKAGFKDLIEQASIDRLLNQDEVKACNKIRKEYRNPYVHVHDVHQDDGNIRPNFLNLHMEMNYPRLNGLRVENKAKETINILVTLFRKISRRGFPLI
jgi:hypothetical protein